jgi:predicted MFS family arabinose efflux permease
MLAILAILIAVCSMTTPFLQYVDAEWLTLIVLAVFGSSAVGWNGVYLAEVARQAPKGQASVATGGTLALTFLGVVVGPPIFGLIASASGSYGIAYASLLAPSGFCLWLLWRYRTAFIK